MNRIIAVIAMIVVLGLVNWSIAGKEKHLAEGKVVYLELAPVDPRSLMQGDYMALRFQIGNQVYNALPKSNDRKFWNNRADAGDGFAIVTLDERKVATFKEIYSDQALQANELLLRYRVRNGTVKFATNAFFFQEGHADVYNTARFGQFRVDSKGELLLAAMYDKELNKLEPAPTQDAD